MSSVHGKTINGQTYYYLREVARIDGKPKIVSQRYLGKAEDIAAAMDAAAVLPTRTRHLAFGEVAATWSVLARLDVAGCIDEILGPRRADAAASVGTYLALAILNRVVAPCSKAGFARWWPPTERSRPSNTARRPGSGWPGPGRYPPTRRRRRAAARGPRRCTRPRPVGPALTRSRRPHRRPDAGSGSGARRQRPSRRRCPRPCRGSAARRSSVSRRSGRPRAGSSRSAR